MIDKLISEIDFALKLYSCPPKGNRTDPSEKVNFSDDSLPEEEKEKIIRYMRVNHTGEICAQALYRGQLLFNQDQTIHKQLNQAASEEIDHLVWCQKRIDQLGGKTSHLNPFFYLASLGMGMIASKIDSQYNLGFLEETEKQVSSHLETHINKIPQKDKKTHAILKQMKYDEEKHQETAKKLGARKLPQVFKKFMKFSSKIMTRTTYWI